MRDCKASASLLISAQDDDNVVVARLETRAFTRPEALQSSVLPGFHPPASLLLP